eukprot:TRINITY_DN6100_c0_g1_i1.p1 TRINITY_DN6100_c0_g1~~TRINITY_DN6100_c0_g1_i1.p1  ORF type:complete len:379 (-),score=80.65 TRINITY_DN6100_c0_g1_i1:129-1265(-)
MGLTGSKLEKTLTAIMPESERYFGYENFGNTCYCNSVLQALYFCVPLREQLLEYYNDQFKVLAEGEEHNLLMCLAELFSSIATQKKKTGVLAPRKFVNKLRKENELFRGFMHQDAHEFLNYLLNECAETLQREQKQKDLIRSSDSPEEDGADVKKSKKDSGKKFPNTVGGTFIHDIFEGALTNETKCLCCESITSKDEAFLDMSIDIEQNTSLTSCLANFSSIETLSRGDKFFCDKCCSLQEAQKRMKIKKLPKILVVHLKRFKFIEQLQQHKKLSYRVTFPLELILQNTSHDVVEPDTKYNLFAVVVHVGSGPNHGHYVCMVKSANTWLIFDDDHIDIINESELGSCFGAATDILTSTDCGYLLFYQSSQIPLTSSD